MSFRPEEAGNSGILSQLAHAQRPMSLYTDACQGPVESQELLNSPTHMASLQLCQFMGWRVECGWISAPTLPLVRARLCAAQTTHHHTKALQRQC